MLLFVKKLMDGKNEVTDDVKSSYREWLKERKSKLSGGEMAYSLIDLSGNIYRPVSMAAPDKPETRSHRPLIHPVTRKECPVPAKGWRFTNERMDELLKTGQLLFGVDENNQPQRKYLLSENLTENVPSLLYFGGSDDALGLPFNNPKPVSVVKKMIESVCKVNDITLDFFAGSGTIAHAVMELNLEDGGNRQSICVQMPEVLDKDSEGYKAGYRTIADITRARIGKVIAKLKVEHPEKTTDLACAHFTLAPSNFKVWRGDANTPEALREQLALFQTAEKMDSRLRENDENLHTAMLAELLLKHGLGALGVDAISSPLALAGVTVHRVLMADDRHLWLCFDAYNPALKDEIVNAKPAQVMLLNSCFVGPKADELLSNLQLELAGQEIGLTVI